VIGFSNFIWNSRLALTFARYLRNKKPGIVVVFGGLHYSTERDKQEQWLAANPVVDFHVYKEGESGFRNLIAALEANAMDVERVKAGDIEGVHFRRPDGTFHITPPAPRVRDLTAIPSPYVSGMLDEFFDGRLMPVLTTNRGCPFQCTFCSEGS